MSQGKRPAKIAVMPVPGFCLPIPEYVRHATQTEIRDYVARTNPIFDLPARKCTPCRFNML